MMFFPLRVAAFSLLAAGLCFGQYGPPKISQNTGIDQRLNADIPLGLQFNDEDGQAVRLQDYFGRKPVILALVYYRCPNLCNLTMQGMSKALKKVTTLKPGADYTVLAVSFDPRETPEVAKAKKANYAASYGQEIFNDGVHLLTGDEASIRKLADAVGFRYRWDEQSQQFVHATGIMVATNDGHVSKYLYGIDYLPRDVRLALVEASADKIGSPVDQFLLFCFHYSPVQGRYSLQIMNVLKIAGGLTALGLGFLVAFFLLRDRRQKIMVDARSAKGVRHV